LRIQLVLQDDLNSLSSEHVLVYTAPCQKQLYKCYCCCSEVALGGCLPHALAASSAAQRSKIALLSSSTTSTSLSSAAGVSSGSSGSGCWRSS
jgi:hypothetical protein